MTQPTDPTAILAQINSARDQTYQNIALNQSILQQTQAAAADAARDRAAVAAMAQQSVTVDTSVGTRVMAGDVMIHGDTGKRDCSSLLNGQVVTSGLLSLRRSGNVVSMELINVKGADTSRVAVAILPLGFRPRGVAHYGLTYWSNQFYVLVNGTVDVAALPGGQYLSTTFLTSDLWPTSLPGIAA